MTRRRRRCEACAALVAFIYTIERGGLLMRVCQDDLIRGDKVYHGRGRNDYTVWTYQTGRGR